jgi:hypothetical protein
VNNKEAAYAPWEREFDSDRALLNASREGEFELKAPVNPSLTNTTLMTKAQWRKNRNRKVIVGDEQAKRVIVTKTGYKLHLFSSDQTKERKNQEPAGGCPSGFGR